jgi:II/X family phage/plasmid replication protein
MLGHNVWGGPLNILRAVNWLVLDLMRRFDCLLPHGGSWEVQRLDWANVYDLGSSSVVGDYLWAMNQASYPRRKPHNYGRTGAFFPGDTTAVKFYAKGVEFRRHDYARLRRSPAGGLVLAKEVAERADRFLRVEVSIKAPVLDKAYGTPLVENIAPEWVADRWEREVQKVIREGRTDMEIVRTAAAVRARLSEVFAARLASTLYATWVTFSTLGEDQAKSLMTHDTFYRHRRQLVAVGCSWRGTDVQLIDAAPSFGNFAPTLVHPSRVVDIHPRVMALLADLVRVA